MQDLKAIRVDRTDKYQEKIERLLVDEVFGKDGQANIYIDKVIVEIDNVEKDVYVATTDDYGFDCQWFIEIENEQLMVKCVKDAEGSSKYNMTLMDYIKTVLN